MTIDKAIEILAYSFADPWVAPKGPFADAIKLGIEALKFYQLLKTNGAMPLDRFLPGETK